MSAEGDGWAVISLGISCQGARQIRKNLDLLSTLTGVEMRHSSHFFDSLIAPVDGISALLRDGFPMFDRADIADGPGHPTWQPYGLRFLHHFRDRTGVEADIDAYFARDQSKFAHLRYKLFALRDVPNLIFIVQNTQNNLATVAPGIGLASIAFDAGGVAGLGEAVAGFLGRPHPMIILSYPDRIGDLDPAAVHLLTPDDSEWEGDKVQWQSVFRRVFAGFDRA